MCTCQLLNAKVARFQEAAPAGADTVNLRTAHGDRAAGGVRDGPASGAGLRGGDCGHGVAGARGRAVRHKAQVRLLQRQDQALAHRIDQVGRAQGVTRRRGGARRRDGSGERENAPHHGSGGEREDAGRVGMAVSGNATSSSGPATTQNPGTVQEQRTATAAPSFASIGGTPPIPSNKALTYLGVTLYGALDLAVAYQNHRTRNSDGPQLSVASNALSPSNVGLRGTEPVLPGLAVVFNMQTMFVPTSGRLVDGPASQVQNNGVAPNRQSPNGDSSLAGQAFNAQAYAGLTSPRYGTLTFGRQNALTLDGVIAYDPMFASGAFSVLGSQGITAGGGDTEDARVDGALKYLVGYGPAHAGVLSQINGASGRGVNADQHGGRSEYQFDLGAEYAGLDVDAIYSQVYDAIATRPLSAAQALAQPAGTLAAMVSDNRSLLLLAKYKVGRLRVFAGYQNILYSNPRDPLGAGSTAAGGTALSVINNRAYTRGRLLQVFWGGARYDLGRALSLDVGYYHEHQSSFSGDGCGDTSRPACRGDLNGTSVLLDDRLSPRFDVYAGALLSTLSNGFASGYRHNTIIDPTVGARLAF